MEFAYHYHLPMTVDTVLFAVGLLVTILFAVVTVHEYRIAKSNPVNGLRTE